jgi:hypothetical protein
MEQQGMSYKNKNAILQLSLAKRIGISPIIAASKNRLPVNKA